MYGWWNWRAQRCRCRMPMVWQIVYFIIAGYDDYEDDEKEKSHFILNGMAWRSQNGIKNKNKKCWRKKKWANRIFQIFTFLFNIHRLYGLKINIYFQFKSFPPLFDSVYPRFFLVFFALIYYNTHPHSCTFSYKIVVI